MRTLNKSWIGIALAILFGLSLFFFRGSSRYSNLFNSDNFVANVSGTQISTSHFLRSLEMNIGQFAQMIGEDLSGDQIRAFQIHQLVLQNLINNAIFENEFDNINYILDDFTIAKKTKERFPNLYVNNKINDDSLNNFLKQQRLKIEDLVNIISYETRANVFDNLFFQKDYPNHIEKKINLFNNQTRKIELLKVPFIDIVVPKLDESNFTKDNTQLVEYFEKNSMLYMTEEKRDISYIVLSKKNYKENFIPNQEEVTNYFENNKDLFSIPEKRSFKQFNFKSDEEAENFRININNLENTEIKEFASKNNIKFNEFESVDSNQVLDELSNVIFSLNKNEVSNVVTTTLAHHIIILDNIEPKRDPSIDEVSEEIVNTLTNVRLENYFNDLKLKVTQQVLDGLSMDEISSINNLQIKSIKKTAQNTQRGEIIENAIIKTAFTQNKDFISDIYEYDIDNSFILNVNDIYPSTKENIENVYDIVLSDYIKSKKLELAKEAYETNKNLNNLNKFSSMYDLKIENQEVKLNSNLLPNSLIRNIFEIELNAITFSSDNENVYYVKVDDIVIPTEGDSSQDISLISELKNAFGNEIIKTKNISINDELINGLLSQYK